MELDESLPDKSPLASGNLTIIAIFIAFAFSNSISAGLRRKTLKMIWREFRPSCSIQIRASSMLSTLTPQWRIKPAACCFRISSKTSPCLKTSVGRQCSCVRSRLSTPRCLSESSVQPRRFSGVKLSGNTWSPRPSLVATNNSPGFSFRNFPINCSLRPPPYTSAVSRKLTPLSTAARKMPRASASSRSPQQSPPNCQQPSPTSET